MAKLPAVIESLDKVEEPVRGFYVEKEGGGFVLDADVEAHPTVAGLKATKTKQSAELKTLAASLARFNGVDPERYQQLVKEAEEREASGHGPPDAEKLRKKLEADLRKEYEPVLKENIELKAKDTKHDLFDVADKAALEGGILPERLGDARKVYADFIRLNSTSKKFEVLDDEGEPTGESAEKFFAERFKKQKPWFYAGSGASGGGAQPSGGLGGGDAEVRKLPGGRMVEAAFSGGHTKAK